jgi:DNA-binding beta-propeller fold protein YncE
MKKNFFRLILLAVVTVVCVSCEDDDNIPSPDVEVKSVGAYFVNNGGWNDNNGSIQYYDYETGLVSGDLYKQANGKSIGDAQDLCIYGSKLYVTCSSSSKLEVLDLKGKIIKTIPLQNATNQPIQPRQLTAADGKVYFTAYDGTVSKLDTLSLNVEGSVYVGPYPEALTVADKKLYVNISNYTQGNQIAVVDLVSFTKTTDVEVLLNPYNQSLTAEGKVYFVSCGTYNNPSIPAEQRVLQTLQCLDPKTNKVTTLCQASAIAYYEGKMYCIYADYYTPKDTSIFSYDLATGKSQSLIDPSTIANPTAINVDPVNGNIYIASPGSSGAPSSIYVFENDGKAIKVLEAGYYAAGVRFLQQ